MADVVDLIQSDHRAVEVLFAKFQQDHDPDIATQICDELDRHTFGEEQAVYPAIGAQVPDGKKLMSEAVKEHKEARQLIGRVRNTSNPDHLAELMTELEHAIQHHVHEEETEILPKTRQALDATTLAKLGEEFEQAKAKAL
jgi:hemerythrin superfamily protein